MTKILKIATEFSDTPGPRYKTEGPYSGEMFREDVLYPQFQEIVASGSKLVVDLDGTQGCVEMGSHKVCQIELTVLFSYKQRTTF